VFEAGLGWVVDVFVGAVVVVELNVVDGAVVDGAAVVEETLTAWVFGVTFEDGW
jgi:hypothetical protein